MPRKCSISGYRSNYYSRIGNNGAKSTFSFPKNVDLKKKWLRVISRDHRALTKYSGVHEWYFNFSKGDSTIYAFEITEEPPYICPLSHHRCNTLHQGLSFLPKNVCDVSNVEFAKALRLTNNSIEPLSFTVPRIKTDLFQDDLFPPTRVTWEPALSSSDWFNDKDRAPQRISLQPEGMELLSESQGQANSGPERTINKSASTPFIGASQPYNRLGWNADMSGQTKSKQEEIKKSVSNKLEMNLSLEQDDMEGVDEKEWNE